MPVLTFDEEKHAYYLDGVRLPSVTQIIDDLAIGPIYPPGDYRVRGRQVHKACELLDLGVIDQYTIGDTIMRYVESYAKMLRDIPVEWDSMEQISYHPELFYAGTHDRVGLMWGEPSILDFKTGKPGRETGLQLAGYALMKYPRDYRPVRRFKAELQPDGRQGRLVEYTDPFDFDGFVGAVNLYKWKRRK